MLQRNKTWTGRLSIPFLVGQMIIEFILILSLSGLLAVEAANKVVPGDILFLTFVCLSLVLEPVLLLFQAYSVLKLWIFESFQLFKAAIATALAVYELVRFFEAGVPLSPLDSLEAVERVVVLVNAIIALLFAVSCYASSLYGAIIWKSEREKKGYDSLVKEQNFYVS